MCAALRGNTDVVRVLLECEDEKGKHDFWGNTALMRAAQNGHVECVKLLREYEKGMQSTELSIIHI